MLRAIFLATSALLAALWLNPGRCLAQPDDHLVPLTGTLVAQVSDCTQAAALRQELGLDSVSAPLALVVVQPSFAPAYALWVARTGPAAYRLHYRRARQPAPALPAARARHLALDPALAQCLLDVVDAALAQTRYDSFQGIRGDGTTYTLLNFVLGRGFRGGEVWSPVGGLPAMGKLVELINNVEQAATQAGTPTFHFSQAALLSQARALLVQLASR